MCSGCKADTLDHFVVNIYNESAHTCARLNLGVYIYIRTLIAIVPLSALVVGYHITKARGCRTSRTW